MLKSSALLVGGRAGISVMRFSRTVILTQLISVEEYGVATTFIIAYSFLDLVSDLALDRLVVQDRNGEDPKFIAAIQALALLRAMLLTAFMVAMAGPIAEFFGHPDLAWAYRLLAVAATCRGFMHLDTYREQRAMRFNKMVFAEFSSVAVCLVIVWPLALWLGDARVMLGLLIVEAAVRSGSTLLLADRPFRVRWDGAVFLKALRFSVPLVVSSLFGFAAMQGDRLIVANQFTAYELGLFGAAVTLAMTPSSFVANVSRSLFLPQLAARQQDPAALADLARIVTQALLLVGVAAMLAFAVLGPFVYVTLFGAKFQDGAYFMPLLGVMFAILIAREAPYSTAMSVGETRALPLTVLARLVSLPIALWVVMEGGGMLGLLTVGVVGEVSTFVISAFVLKRVAPALSARFVLGVSLTVLGVAGCILAAAHLPERAAMLHLAAAALFAVAAACSGAFWGWMGPFLVEAAGKIRRRLG